MATGGGGELGAEVWVIQAGFPLPQFRRADFIYIGDLLCNNVLQEEVNKQLIS